MAVEQQPEVRFPQPTVDVRADLDADCFRHHARAPEPRGEKDLAESALSEHPLDAILQARFRTVDHFGRHEQVARLRSRARHVDGCGGASGGGRSGTQTRMEHSTRGAALFRAADYEDRYRSPTPEKPEAGVVRLRDA